MARNYDFWFDHITSGIDEGMRDLQDYLSSVSVHLTHQEDSFAKRVREYEADSSGDELGDYSEHLGVEAEQLDLFRKLLQHSTLGLIVTYFELQTVKLTRADFRIRERANCTTAQELEARAKKEVRRFENLGDYWRKHGLNYNQGQLWDDITKIGKIRNKVAHTNGELDNDGDSEFIRKYVEQRLRDNKTSLKVEDGMIVVEPAYCLEAIETFKRFLLQLLEGTSLIK